MIKVLHADTAKLLAESLNKRFINKNQIIKIIYEK